ncbi:hypothetical protein A7K99_01720 [Tatumella citrea]|uniref:Uncharacterized protein n=1 Tax=Tatumella citrea TaxID=53336 RepID=A0A1Y0L4E5_TATCI|nr:hypothetical protein A7K98_01720 [Tatumella citrea]ARU96656.1 hypothetical protein A7K99_01720 [Tatumella citrea]
MKYGHLRVAFIFLLTQVNNKRDERGTTVAVPDARYSPQFYGRNAGITPPGPASFHPAQPSV